MPLIIKVDIIVNVKHCLLSNEKNEIKLCVTYYCVRPSLHPALHVLEFNMCKARQMIPWIF